MSDTMKELMSAYGVKPKSFTSKGSPSAAAGNPLFRTPTPPPQPAETLGVEQSAGSGTRAAGRAAPNRAAKMVGELAGGGGSPKGQGNSPKAKAAEKVLQGESVLDAAGSAEEQALDVVGSWKEQAMGGVGGVVEAGSGFLGGFRDMAGAALASVGSAVADQLGAVTEGLGLDPGALGLDGADLKGVRFNGAPQSARPMKSQGSTGAKALNSAGSITRSLSRGRSMSRSNSMSKSRDPSASNVRVQTRQLNLEKVQAQMELRAQIKAINSEHLSKQAAKNDEAALFPRATLSGPLGSVGYGGFLVSEEDGGLGMDAADAAVAFEELGRADAALAGYLTIHNMVSYLVANFGSFAATRLLKGLSGLSLLGTYCVTEISSGSDPTMIQTVAEKDDSGQFYLLHGTKTFVAAGGLADYMLVLARTSASASRGLSAFLVAKSTAGVTFGKPEHTTGWRSIPLSSVTFTKVLVRHEFLLGKEGQGMDILHCGLDMQRTWLSAVSVGGAQACFDYTLSYCKGRKQGLKTVTDHQAVQFKFVEMHAQLSSSRLMVQSAAQQLDAQAPASSMEAAMVKRYVTEAALRVASDCIPLMGGAGLLPTHPLDRMVRDLRAHLIVGGTSELMALAVFKDLRG